jgi:hypothetical protein
MGERDAFGREQGEDTLAEMGWRRSWPATVTPGDPLVVQPLPRTAAPSALAAGEASAPFPAGGRPEPTPAAPARAPRPAAPAFARRRRRRGGPSLAKLIILVAFLGAAGLAVQAVLYVGGNAVDSIRGGIDAVVPAPAPSATAPRSLVRAAPLRAALGRLPHGRLVSLRVAPDRIDAQVVSGGTRHIVEVRADGSKNEVKAAAGVAQPRLLVNPGAPLRIARTAARRSGRPVAGVDYLVRTQDGWLLFFKDGGPRYRASASGRRVARL